jgi:hypothetical protein
MSKRRELENTVKIVWLCIQSILLTIFKLYVIIHV